MIIDFHTHIIPGVDHGCSSVREAIRQLDILSSAKTNIAVATSHFYPHIHRINDYVSDVDEAISRVRSELGERKLGISLAIGAEVLACETIDRMPDLDKLCIRGTKCLMLEMPACGDWSRIQLEAIKNLVDGGYKVILAHIDRYMKRYEKEIDRLIAMGAVAQVNADSLSTLSLRKKMMGYIDGGYVFALGSDIHGSDKTPYKDFARLERRIGSDNLKTIMERSTKLLETAEFVEL